MERPLLFNTEMVQAILEGRKTQTRRIIKPQPKTIDIGPKNVKPFACWVDCSRWIKPPSQVGDILWVRETWQLIPSGFDEIPPEYHYIYAASDELSEECTKWRPSIHMPRTAARIFLNIVDVRAERLQDITIDQAIAEGAMRNPPTFPRAIMRDIHHQNLPYAIASFAVIWDRTIKESDIDKYGWDANPWVWIIEFERVAAPNETEGC